MYKIKLKNTYIYNQIRFHVCLPKKKSDSTCNPYHTTVKLIITINSASNNAISLMTLLYNNNNNIQIFNSIPIRLYIQPIHDDV